MLHWRFCEIGHTFPKLAELFYVLAGKQFRDLATLTARGGGDQLPATRLSLPSHEFTENLSTQLKITYYLYRKDEGLVVVMM
jgi:hypothetical protein